MGNKKALSTGKNTSLPTIHTIPDMALLIHQKLPNQLAIFSSENRGTSVNQCQAYGILIGIVKIVLESKGQPCTNIFNKS